MDIWFAKSLPFHRLSFHFIDFCVCVCAEDCLVCSSPTCLFLFLLSFLLVPCNHFLKEGPPRWKRPQFSQTWTFIWSRYTHSMGFLRSAHGLSVFLVFISGSLCTIASVLHLTYWPRTSSFSAYLWLQTLLCPVTITFHGGYVLEFPPSNSSQSNFLCFTSIVAVSFKNSTTLSQMHMNTMG